MNAMTYENMKQRLMVMGIKVVEVEEIHYDYEGQDESVGELAEIIDIAQHSVRPVVFCTNRTYESEFVSEIANTLYGTDALSDAFDKELMRLVKANPSLDVDYVMDYMEDALTLASDYLSEALDKLSFLARQTEFVEFAIFRGSEAYSYTARTGEDLLAKMEEVFKSCVNNVVIRMDACAVNLICSRAA